MRTDERTDRGLGGPRGRAGGVLRERGGPGVADWLAGGVGGAAGGWAAAEGAGRSPRAEHRRVPLSPPRARRARASASLRPGVLWGIPGAAARPSAVHSGGAYAGVSRGGVTAPGPLSRSPSPALSPARAPEPREGAGSGLCLPPPAPPRGPDSGVRGRTGDARPVYPPRGASAPTGGATRAREGEGNQPRPCDVPWALRPGTQNPHPSPSSLRSPSRA